MAKHRIRWPRRRPKDHPAIELEVWLRGEKVIDVDSEQLYYITRFGGYGKSYPDPNDLLSLNGVLGAAQGVRIYARPIRLPNRPSL